MEKKQQNEVNRIYMVFTKRWELDWCVQFEMAIFSAFHKPGARVADSVPAILGNLCRNTVPQSDCQIASPNSRNRSTIGEVHVCAVADPGFPRGGANLLFGNFFFENCLKMKEIGRGVRA